MGHIRLHEVPVKFEMLICHLTESGQCIVGYESLEVKEAVQVKYINLEVISIKAPFNSMRLDVTACGMCVSRKKKMFKD